MIHLNDTQIEALVGFDEAIPVLEVAFRALAQGRAAVQRRVRTEAGGVKLSTLGAVLPDAGVTGAKVYTTINGRFSFSIVLFSTEDGRPLATLDANVLTRIRTAATTVIAIRALARDGARTVAIYGTGVQGRAHAQALAGHTALKHFRIVGLDGVAALVDEINTRYGTRGIEAVAAESANAVRDADVIITATRATGALFDGTTLAPGATIAAIGSSLPYTRELDDHTLSRAARIVVELTEQAKEEAGDLVQAAAGTFAWRDVVELGDVLEGRAGGRVNPGDIIVYKAVGIGLQDIALAGLAWRNHVARDAAARHA
jgi:ornithine cyclodeaminase